MEPENRPPYTFPPYGQPLGGEGQPPPAPVASVLDIVVGVVTIILGSLGVLCGALVGAVGTLGLSESRRTGGLGGIFAVGAFVFALIIILTHLLLLAGGVGIVRFKKSGFVMTGILCLIIAIFEARGFFGVRGNRQIEGGRAVLAVVIPLAMFAVHGFISIYSFVRMRFAN